MPKVNMLKLAAMTAKETELFKLVVKKDKSVRASKPNVKSYTTGMSAYVWRMTVFMISPKPAHQCMPVCADFDVRIRDFDERRKVTQELDLLVDKIIDAIDKKEWHGISKWRCALGY
jgi:hypothetical protein